MRAVYIVALCYFILLLPIFCGLYLIFDANEKKCYFSFTIFGINVFGGYVVYDNKKLYVHYNNKAKIINLTDYLMGNKQFLKLNFDVLQLKSVCILGVKNSLSLYLGGLLYTVNNQICPIIKAKKSFLIIKNDLAFTNDKSFKIVAKAKLLFGLLGILLLALKNIFKGSKNGKLKRKQS